MAYATVEELAQEMNVRVTAGNTPALQSCLDAAAVEIDHEVAAPPEEPTDPDNPLANRVNILRAVEWWKSNDAAFGVIGLDETGVLQAPRDGFNRHAYALTPLKRRWGVA